VNLNRGNSYSSYCMLWGKPSPTSPALGAWVRVGAVGANAYLCKLRPQCGLFRWYLSRLIGFPAAVGLLAYTPLF